MLFNIAFARKHGGTVVLRSEDTDKARSKQEYERELVEVMHWLGLSWDEGLMLEDGFIVSKGEYGPYRQSERTDLYKKYILRLIENGHAYYCYCTKEELEAQEQSLASGGLPLKYAGHCRELKAPPTGKTPEVIRFKTPQAHVKHHDLVRGQVSFDAGLFGDFVIAKNAETPLYNLAAVVDDYEMRITHVIRGEEHISNTPKQILMAQALGFEPPEFAHLPLILAENRSKMSKRYMETSLMSYREKGYMPEAIVNFLALLGWHPSGDAEVFSLAEFCELFDLRRVQKAGAIFNEEKLEWLNGEYIKKLSEDELMERLAPLLSARDITGQADLVRRIARVERERAHTLADILDLGGFFFALPEYDASLLLWNDDGKEKAKRLLESTGVILGVLTPADFAQGKLREALLPLTDEHGRGSILWPLRVALSGQKASPDPFAIMEVLGKEETLRRVAEGIKKL
jgi:glutamyl-tRNA synthetase